MQLTLKNIGFYPIALAKFGWNVTTFEPMPANAEILQASICANADVAKQIDLHAVGLSDVDDHCQMVSAADNFGGGNVRCGALETKQGYEVHGEADLRVLDEELPNSRFASQPVMFVKTDAEGFECRVLQGASNLLQTKPPFLLSEVTPHMEACTPAGYLQIFRDAGHEVKADVRFQNPPPGLVEDHEICGMEHARLHEVSTVLMVLKT